MKKVTLKRKETAMSREHKRLLKEDRRPSPEENYRMAIEGYILDFYNHIYI